MINELRTQAGDTTAAAKGKVVILNWKEESVTSSTNGGGNGAAVSSSVRNGNRHSAAPNFEADRQVFEKGESK